MLADIKQSKPHNRSPADSGEFSAVPAVVRRLPHAYLGLTPVSPRIEVDRHSPREGGRPVPYRSALRRDERAPVTPDGNPTWAGFLGLCATAVCTWLLCEFDDGGIIWAAVGLGALPGGLVTVSVMGSFRPAVHTGCVAFALVLIPVGFFLLCTAGIFGLLLTAIGLVLAMFWFTLGALIGAPLARGNPRTLRARRWPDAIRNTRRMS